MIGAGMQEQPAVLSMRALLKYGEGKRACRLHAVHPHTNACTTNPTHRHRNSHLIQ